MPRSTSWALLRGAVVRAGRQAARADAAAAGRGLAEKLYCTQCHGAELQGQQHIPRLAGQQAEYLRIQLLGFKAGTRFDMDGNMTAARRR
jgi:cytochrome c553